ncbi:winged helix-turn-helix domain-containing protein [Streptomyces sp. NPDC087300]|uniref:winged helix-turn-helix domain-containing protein n=1 Tax=Streptomyces sp. NPDC087300 TaxID=3365780 RepID=UPI0037F3A579
MLLVEDDDGLRFAVAAALRAAGFDVDESADLPAADEASFVTAYDCAVFDRTLPAGDAAAHVARLRRAGRTVPVLFLADGGASAAGDDPLVRPFALPELVARVRSLCRGARQAGPAVYRVGDVRIDIAGRQVHRGGPPIDLSGREFAVLELLAARPGQVVPRADIVASCWDGAPEPRSNVLEVLVSQLRRKLGTPQLIRTVRGIGYRLAADPA